MKDFGSTCGEGVRVVVAEFMQKLRFDGFVGVGAVNAIDVGPDDQFGGVDNVSDDGSGKIGAVATEGGDAAVGCGPDETGHDGHEAIFE
jgi:uncharacterized phage protein gp47/JayE